MASPPASASHPDLQAEQAHIDRAYDRLEAMRRAAAEMRDSVVAQGRGGTPQARIERDVFVRVSLARLEQLELGRSALCFGRIDRADGERFHIGRLAVSDTDHQPLVVDWRAPVAEPFYRATGLQPMSLLRRRHFATDGRTLVGIEDEFFDGHGARALGAWPGLDGGSEIAGPGALLAALDKSRTGQMRDIVATVQREQDEVIRADLAGVLVLQGGPGTGKTAVALHRAAYLLYTHRFPLEAQGVLVVGPNQVFLRYIEAVLPSLGESGVALTTLAGLLPDYRPQGEDPPAVARLKGEARMAKLLARAVRDRERPLREDLEIGIGALVLRVKAAATEAIVGSARRLGGPHNRGRRHVERLVLRALIDSYTQAVARQPESAPPLDADVLADELRHHPAVVAALDRMWPVLAPEELLNDLFGSPTLLRLAGRRGLLDRLEREMLARPRASTLDDVVWRPADLPLLDEARFLLGRADEPRAYGHIVADEAQDLSAMALRMLSRRSISGSMTLVGDLGQALTLDAPAHWGQTLSMLPARRPGRVATLSINYRTPAEIMEVANKVLAAAGVDGATPLRSVRSTHESVMVHATSQAELPDVVADTAAEQAIAVEPGTVGVIAPRAIVAALGAALGRAGVDWGDPERRGLSAPVTLLGLMQARGLEFDALVVVEPAALVSESPQGLRALYVALTRATRRLAIVHAAPLPVPLAGALLAAG